MGVGFPDNRKLQAFGEVLLDYFGHPAYHVGSSLTEKRGWRDVDVRFIMDDKDWDREGFGDPEKCHDNPKWLALCMAFTALGREMTGLPIDFQIQSQTWANEKNDGQRSALFQTHRLKG